MPLTPQERRRSLLVLGVFWFFTGVEYAVILPSAWQYLQNLGATHKIWLSVSISAFSVANFLFSPLYGRFADRHSTKTILIVSNVFEIVGNLLYLFANDTYTNVESRFIAGMGAAAGSAIFAYIGRASASPSDLNKNMGGVMTARAIGLILGPAFNFFLIKVEWNIAGFKIDPYNSPGLLMTLIWLVCQVIVIKYFKDIPKDDIEMGVKAKPDTASTTTTAEATKPAADSSASTVTAQPQSKQLQQLAGETSTDGVNNNDDDDDDDDDDDGENEISARTPLQPQAQQQPQQQAQQQQAPPKTDETEDDTPKCSEFLGLGVVALLLVQFLNMFNQTAYETFITPFTQSVFHWDQVANSIVYMITAFLAIAVYIGISKLQ